jgi:hypothetical protein
MKAMRQNAPEGLHNDYHISFRQQLVDKWQNESETSGDSHFKNNNRNGQGVLEKSDKDG